MKLADGLTPPPHLPELLLCREVLVLLLQVLVLDLVLQCCRITGSSSDPGDLNIVQMWDLVLMLGNKR